MKKKILLSIGVMLYCTSTIEASQVSQTLQEQLNNDRGTFDIDLTNALDDNNIVPLSTVTVPRATFVPASTLPIDQHEFIQDDQKLLELGKALYWDIQVGDDGRIACATCHNNGGTDQRTQNTLSFAATLKLQDGRDDNNRTFSNDKPTSPGFGPNIQLSASDFPRSKKSDKRNVFSPFIRETNTVIGSAGVHFRSRLNNGQRYDNVDNFLAPVQLDPTDFKLPFANTGTTINTRRVGSRQAPTVINAVFNYRQFWNGIASNVFNGVTPFGPDDTRAKVLFNSGNTLSQLTVRFKNASLASQAVGPPSNPSEMTVGDGIGSKFGHNEFVEGVLRRGLLYRRPLARQHVDPTDSVLGSLARPGKGLTVRNYKTMIEQAFKPEWWNNTTKRVKLNDDNGGDREIVTAEVAAADNNSSVHYFTQMETNIALFFGLAIDRYEQTLISDDTRVDRYLAGDHTALTDSELIGFRIAAKEGRCLNCHGGGEFTYASVSKIERNKVDPERLDDSGLVRKRKGDIIDEGFNNIGVTPTLDDLGIGDTTPQVAFSRQFILSEARRRINDINLAKNLDLHLASDGAFKIPTLRNVELTAPYFHNGSESTLEDVVDFYFRGGNYRTNELNRTTHNHPIIGFSADRTQESKITGLGILSGPNKDSNVSLNADDLNPDGLDDEDRDHLVDFLKALTDDRVRFSRAPFDHPELPIPEGHFGDRETIAHKSRGVARDHWHTLPAVGREGTSEPFETFNDKLAQP